MEPSNETTVPLVHEASSQDLDSDRHFQLLLVDYQSAREDDRTLLTVLFALVGVAVPIVGALNGTIARACNFSANLALTECAAVPELVLAGVPLLAIVTAVLLLALGTISKVRSYYLRAIERQLREYVHHPFEAMPGTGFGPGMYKTVTTELTRLTRGRLSHRLLVGLTVPLVALIFVLSTVYILLSVSEPIRILMVAFYGPLFALVVYEYIAAGLGGRSLFTRAVLAASERSGKRDYLPTVEEYQKLSRQRSIVSYLVYPRLEDWSKPFNSAALYLPVALLVGDFSRLADFVLLVLVLELLIFQARYQFNDVRNVSSDRLHVESYALDRLPQSGYVAADRQYVLWSLTVAVLRLAAAGMIGYYFLPEIFWLLGAVFVISCCYEALRSKSPRQLVQRPTARVVLIWLAPGLGYAVRGGLAIALAGVALDTATGIVGIAFYYTLGVMFALIASVLHAASYCRIDQNGQWVYSRELVAQPHFSVLLTFVRPLDRMHSELKTIPFVGYGARQRVLANREHFWTPWSVMFIVAAGFGGALGALLCTGGEFILPLTLLAAAAGAGGAAFVAWSRSGKARKLTYLVATVVLAAVPYAWASMSGTEFTAPEWIPSEAVGLAVVLPWLSFWVFYVDLLDQSYHHLKYSLQVSLIGIVMGAALGLRLLVGKSTWQTLGCHDALDSWRDRLIGDLERPSCEGEGNEPVSCATTKEVVDIDD